MLNKFLKLFLHWIKQLWSPKEVSDDSSDKGYSEDKIEALNWEGFWDGSPITNLREAFAQYPQSDEEDRIAARFQRHLYDQVRPIEELYALIEGIYQGNSLAIETFNTKLQKIAIARDLSNTPPELIKSERPAFRAKCPDIPLIPRQRIVQLYQAAHYLNSHNRDLYGLQINAIIHLYSQISCIDAFGLWAQRDKRDRGTRFNDALDEIIDKSGYKESLPKWDSQWTRPHSRPGEPIPEDDTPSTYPPNWPPPEPGMPGAPSPCGPGGGSPPSLPPREPCDDFHDTCTELMRGSFHQLELMPNAISSHQITSISPTSACFTQPVTIKGEGFGEEQGDWVVIFGTAKAEVTFWSDTEIRVKCPRRIGEVCVSLRNTQIEARRRDIYERNKEALTEYNEQLQCLGKPGTPLVNPYAPQSAECNQVNRFLGSYPIIREFSINGISRSVDVDVGTELTLRWEVENADSVSIQRTGLFGPNAEIDGPTSGNDNLGEFTGSESISATYKLTAMNACSTINRFISVRLTTPSDLNNLGIEITQTIQNFDFDNISKQNEVLLVAQKSTLARVYPVSGIQDSFNFGDGPGALANISGDLNLHYTDGTFQRISNPVNPDQITAAQSRENIDRSKIDHSLNFVLPIEKLTGVVMIKASIYESGHFRNPYYGEISRVPERSFEFQNSGNIKIALIRIADGVQNLPAPSVAQFWNSVIGAQARFPIKENGFRLFTPTDFPIRTTTQDLSRWGDTRNLLDRLDDIADDYEDSEDYIWCGLLPFNGEYRWGGMAHDGVEDYWFDSHKRFLAKSGSGVVFAHELAHTFGIDHAPNIPGCTASIDDLDPDVPSRIEDHGIVVEPSTRTQPFIIPAGTTSFMGYCVPDNGYGEESKWISIATYERLFDLIDSE
ncbi:MAG: IPT/TIG domain-containing protein [Opitutales bacterium]